MYLESSLFGIIRAVEQMAAVAAYGLFQLENRMQPLKCGAAAEAAAACVAVSKVAQQVQADMQLNQQV